MKILFWQNKWLLNTSVIQFINGIFTYSLISSFNYRAKCRKLFFEALEATLNQYLSDSSLQTYVFNYVILKQVYNPLASEITYISWIFKITQLWSIVQSIRKATFCCKVLYENVVWNWCIMTFLIKGRITIY